MIELLDDRIMVKEEAPDEKLGSGVLYAPDTAKESSQRGRVVAVGPGKFHPELVEFFLPEEDMVDELAFFSGGAGRRPVVARVGDLVLFGKYSGEEYKHQGEKYKIVREHDVIAVIERAK